MTPDQVGHLIGRSGPYVRETVRAVIPEDKDIGHGGRSYPRWRLQTLLLGLVGNEGLIGKGNRLAGNWKDKLDKATAPDSNQPELRVADVATEEMFTLPRPPVRQVPQAVPAGVSGPPPRSGVVVLEPAKRPFAQAEGAYEGTEILCPFCEMSNFGELLHPYNDGSNGSDSRVTSRVVTPVEMECCDCKVSLVVERRKGNVHVFWEGMKGSAIEETKYAPAVSAQVGPPPPNAAVGAR